MGNRKYMKVKEWLKRGVMGKWVIMNNEMGQGALWLLCYPDNLFSVSLSHSLISPHSKSITLSLSPHVLYLPFHTLTTTCLLWEKLSLKISSHLKTEVHPLAWTQTIWNLKKKVKGSIELQTWSPKQLKPFILAKNCVRWDGEWKERERQAKDKVDSKYRKMDRNGISLSSQWSRQAHDREKWRAIASNPYLQDGTPW